MRVVVVVQGQADLLQVILALRAARRFAGLLHGRQQQCNQNGDNRNDDQQLNQCESATATNVSRHKILPSARDEKRKATQLSSISRPHAPARDEKTPPSVLEQAADEIRKLNYVYSSEIMFFRLTIGQATHPAIPYSR
jgi:hypothetical protein